MQRPKTYHRHKRCRGGCACCVVVMAPLATKIKMVAKEMKRSNISSGKLDEKLNSSKDEQEGYDQTSTIDK
jgi:hypothetical protein